MLAVKEYLKKNSKARKDYEQIKKEATKYAKGNGEKYRAYKKSFVESLEKKALSSK